MRAVHKNMKPITILVGALGGDGGGVLCDWIIAAAHSQGLGVQATQIPGVAQRTGATTYYLEVMPARGPRTRASSPRSCTPGRRERPPPCPRPSPSMHPRRHLRDQPA